MRRYGWLVAAAVVVALWAWSRPAVPPGPGMSPDTGTSPVVAGTAAAGAAAAPPPAWLPDEARDTLRLIARGGPFPHRQDGAVFQNREHRLPERARGYYREYTVSTPGAGDRGARRLVAGGEPPVEFFYSDDHYRSFRRFDLGARAGATPR